MDYMEFFIWNLLSKIRKIRIKIRIVIM